MSNISTSLRRPEIEQSILNPVFLTLWAMQALTQTSQNVINFALLILAQTITGSTTHVSFIILSFSLPAVIFSSVAGVLVDHWNKRTVMAASNIIRAFAVASYIFVNDSSDMPRVYLASFVLASAAQFFAPAEGAVIPRIVGKRALITANSLYNLTFMASQFLGFTIIGWLLIRFMGLRNVFILIAILYAIAAIVIATLPIPDIRARTDEGISLEKIWQDLREGWHFIIERRSLAITIIHLSIANSSYLMLGTLGPSFVTNILHIRSEDLGLLLAPAGLFTLLGIILVNKLAKPSNRHEMIHFGLMGVGVSVVGLAITTPITNLIAENASVITPSWLTTFIAVLLSMLFGFSAAFVAIPAQTVLQEKSHDYNRARVLSTFYTVSNAASFFPILLAGSIADHIGILQTMTIIGLFIVTVGASSQYLFLQNNRNWDKARIGITETFPRKGSKA